MLNYILEFTIPKSIYIQNYRLFSVQNHSVVFVIKSHMYKPVSDSFWMLKMFYRKIWHIKYMAITINIRVLMPLVFVPGRLRFAR